MRHARRDLQKVAGEHGHAGAARNGVAAYISGPGFLGVGYRAAIDQGRLARQHMDVMGPVGMHFRLVALVAALGIFDIIILMIDRERRLGAGARLVGQGLDILGGKIFEPFRRKGSQRASGPERRRN